MTAHHATPRPAPPRRAAPRRAAPRRAAPRRAAPRHATPRHATPRHATPRHATPRHATPNQRIYIFTRAYLQALYTVTIPLQLLFGLRLWKPSLQTQVKRPSVITHVVVVTSHVLSSTCSQVSHSTGGRQQRQHEWMKVYLTTTTQEYTT